MVYQRVSTATRHMIYLGCFTLLAMMSFETFLAVVATHFFHYRAGRLATYYCDHCHSWNTKLCPSFWDYEKETREAMIALYPSYWETFDNNRKLKRWLQRPEKYCFALRVYMDKFVSRNRAALESSLTETQICNVIAEQNKRRAELEWREKLLRAYAWHRRSNRADIYFRRPFFSKRIQKEYAIWRNQSVTKA